MPDGEWLTVKETAARLGVHRQTLWGWRRDKIGPPWVRVVGQVRYYVADIEKWLEAQRQP